MDQNNTTDPADRVLLGEEHPLSRVQTELFCGQCGASLYEQPVWRSSEARLLVVRCQRCGAIASANEALPYRRIWRQRLGVMLTLGWLCVLGGLLAILVALEYGLQMETPVVGRTKFDPYSASPATDIQLDKARTKERLLWTGPTSLAVAFAGSCLLTCALYHWPAWGHLLAATAVPAVALAFVRLNHTGHYWDSWFANGALDVVLGVAAVQVAGGILGALVNRRVGRFVLRTLLPNRSRQFFAFLWRRDGRDMPVGPF